MNKDKQFPCRCQRCGYEWVGRSEHPYVCPHCHTPLWHVAKKEKAKTAAMQPALVEVKKIQKARILGVLKLYYEASVSCPRCQTEITIGMGARREDIAEEITQEIANSK